MVEIQAKVVAGWSTSGLQHLKTYPSYTSVGKNTLGEMTYAYVRRTCNTKIFAKDLTGHDDPINPRQIHGK